MKKKKFVFGLGVEGWKDMEHDLESDVSAKNGLQSVVIDQIQELLQSCFCFELNPLPTLRRTFPNYQWEFIEDRQMSFRWLVRVYLESDFLFVADDNLVDEGPLIRARRKDSSQPPRIHSSLPLQQNDFCWKAARVARSIADKRRNSP